MKATELKRGMVTVPTKFEAPEGEVIRLITRVNQVIIHYANGVDEVHEADDDVEVIQEED